MRRVSLVHIAIPGLLVLLAPAGLLAQRARPAPLIGEQFDDRVVERLEFPGRREVSEAFCAAQVVTTEGRPFSARVAREDLRRLIRSGKFLDVRLEVQPADSGVAVQFHITERPILESIELVGNVKYSTKSLLKDLELAEGDPLNRFRVELAARSIEQRYKDAGYADVSVSFDAELLQREQRLVLTVEEGPRTRVREIRFEGNIHFESRDLQGLITTKTYLWVLRTGDFNPDRAERDAAEIQNHHRDHGYLDARVSYHTEDLETPGDLGLVFVISEGDLYTIDAIHFEGQVVFTAEELQARVRLQPGSVMRQDILRDDVDGLKDAYGELGYLYAIVEQPMPVFTESPGEVQLTFRIHEGKPYRIGRIVPRGNESTHDKVIRRELEFYPDELFHVPKMRLSEDKIRRTGLFSQAKITPVGDQEQVRDVIVDVLESDRTINFMLGGGVGSNSGVAGSVMYESRNFDIGDWPATWGEFFRGQSFRGAGQYFRLEASPGTEVTSIRIVFREPYFLDRPLSFGTNLFLFQRGRKDYDEERLGAILSLGKTLQSGWFKGWSGELAFRLEDVKISDVDFWPADEIREAKGHNALTTFKGRLVRNRTDSRLVPSRGDIWSLSVEQAAGSYTFTRLEAAYTWYRTLHTDDRDRKGVLAMKADVGFLVGNAPVFERFYAGGIGSMRGFEFRGVTPRDGPFWDDDQRIGGDFRLLTAMEYSFPLWDKALRGVLFADMGTVEEDVEIQDWRAAVGFGLRLLVEQLAPVPFEFNFAIPLAKDGDDDEQVFSFALGLTL